MYVNQKDHKSLSTEVETFLINNYREAMSKGDKSSAKSCLMAARYFSANDQDVTNEIYQMAKADSDVNEASKCFSKIFSDIFVPNENILSAINATKCDSKTLDQVKSQMMEEVKCLLTDLESKHLKLNSANSRESQNNTSNMITSSPTIGRQTSLSPTFRRRMMSIDSRDSPLKSDKQLAIYQPPTGEQKSFYQQLFENLTEEMKRSVLNNSIESAFEEQSILEASKRMMLTMSIFNDTVGIYGSRLLKSLIDLSDQTKSIDCQQLIHSDDMPSDSPLNKASICKQARSLLVLDAIPLVLNQASLSELDIVSEELFERTLNFYSEHYLELAAKEYQVHELHEGMKKSIAARIIGIEHKLTSDSNSGENHVISSLKFLSQKLIELTTDVTVKEKFNEIRSIISDNLNLSSKFDKMMKIIETLDLNEDISDELLSPALVRDPTSQSAPTPPPKARGRPKKVQAPSVIVSLDDGSKRHIQNKLRECQFVFYSIIEYMFLNCARYLKSIRSRILINSDNPLLTHIAENLATLNLSSNQRSSRSKTNNPQTNEEPPNSPTKKIKLDDNMTKLLSYNTKSRENHLHSDQAKRMDQQVIDMLTQARKCYDFLTSDYGIFTKLWKKFVSTNQISTLNWYIRFQIDSLIMSGRFTDASNMLDEVVSSPPYQDSTTMGERIVTSDHSSSPFVSISTLSNPSSSLTISKTRLLTQSISCCLQTIDKHKSLSTISQLLSHMDQTGLLASDICPYENILEDYMIRIQSEPHNNLAFVLFDSTSLLRYSTSILTSILKRLIYCSGSATDTTIGHAIVLSQFDWPKQSHLYNHCLSWIRSSKPKSTTPQTLSASTKFTYPDFFSYIRNQNIIEDFMALLKHGFTLDIKGSGNSSQKSSTGTGSASQNSTTSSRGQSTGSSTRSNKMIATRGVNKTFKEDLKVALVSQMKNSTIDLPLELVARFLRDSLIPYLESIV